MKATGPLSGAFAESSAKKMSIQEFAEKGFLQEANRRFFHPLGLCLVVDKHNDTGEFRISGVEDCREDPEGYIYAEGSVFVEQPEIGLQKIEAVQAEWDRHSEARKNLLGSEVQLIGQIPPSSGKQ